MREHRTFQRMFFTNCLCRTCVLPVSVIATPRGCGAAIDTVLLCGVMVLGGHTYMCVFYIAAERTSSSGSESAAALLCDRPFGQHRAPQYPPYRLPPHVLHAPQKLRLYGGGSRLWSMGVSVDSSQALMTICFFFTDSTVMAFWRIRRLMSRDGREHCQHPRRPHPPSDTSRTSNDTTFAREPVQRPGQMVARPAVQPRL